MNKFQEKHIKLIENSGGIVNDIFVEKVGIILTKKSSVSKEARELFKTLNIDTNSPEEQQHAEFNSRITYLSFNDKPSNSQNYHNKMINELGHRSIYNDEIVTFLIAGASIETMLEFIAHNEATVARLTSSKTKAQDKPLYRIRTKGFSKEFINIQKQIVREVIQLKENIHPTNELENEVSNIMSLGNKAVSFTITMSIKDWHKTLIGRLSNHGVESEMIEILDSICDILNKEYPYFFNTKEEYFSMGNETKYETK